MPSRREIRKNLPEAYWRVAGLVEDELALARELPSEMRVALQEVLMRLEEKAERLARSRGCSERP